MLFRNTLPHLVARELYDYTKDPLETVNVADEKEYKKITAEMEKLMLDFLHSQENKYLKR